MHCIINNGFVNCTIDTSLLNNRIGIGIKSSTEYNISRNVLKETYIDSVANSIIESLLTPAIIGSRLKNVWTVTQHQRNDVKS